MAKAGTHLHFESGLIVTMLYTIPLLCAPSLH